MKISKKTILQKMKKKKKSLGKHKVKQADKLS